MSEKLFDHLIVGCGYLGNAVANAWLEQGQRVAATTRSPQRANEFRDRGIEPIVCDVLDPASLQQLPDAKTVLHAVGYDRSSPHSQRDVYVTGLSHLLKAISGRYEKFIHISSTSIYGQTDGEQVDENSPTEPTRDNGKVVADAERLVVDAAHNSIILRLAGIYGPDRLLARINQRREAMPVRGNPDAWLNLIHQADCVRAVTAAAKFPHVDELFLVSDDRPIRRREYYEMLARLLDAPPPEFQSDATDPKGDRGMGKRCNNRKLHQLLPELSFPTIETGLPDAIGTP